MNHRERVNMTRSPAWHSRQEINRLKVALTQLNRENAKLIKNIKNRINYLTRMTNINALFAQQKKFNNIRRAVKGGSVTARRGPGA